MSIQRHYSVIDQFCISVDQMLRTLTHSADKTGADNPASHLSTPLLSDEEQRRSAALMRVNHAGEVAAQALYHGQQLVTKSDDLKEKLSAAALEEGNHLAWCKERLDELNSHPSYLNPLWYMGSLCIGVGAGLVGDKWSLGFIAETERQVIQHLENHLTLLPANDEKTKCILEKMSADEAHHRDEALAEGAKTLPTLIQWAMRLTSKVMVKTAYFI